MAKSHIKILRLDGESKHMIDGDLEDGLVSNLRMYQLSASSRANNSIPSQLEFTEIENNNYQINISPSRIEFNNQEQRLNLQIGVIDKESRDRAYGSKGTQWFINDEKVGNGTKIQIREENYRDSIENVGRVETMIDGEVISKDFILTNNVLEILQSVNINIIAQDGNIINQDINTLTFIAETVRNNEDIIPDEYRWYLNDRKLSDGFTVTLRGNEIDQGQSKLEVRSIVDGVTIINKEIINKIESAQVENSVAAEFGLGGNSKPKPDNRSNNEVDEEPEDNEVEENESDDNNDPETENNEVEENNSGGGSSSGGSREWSGGSREWSGGGGNTEGRRLR